MKNPFAKKTRAFLTTDSRELRNIFSRIKQIDEINQLITPHLDPSIRPYCQVINCTEERMTLIVANGSIATQIRFQTADLLRKFKQEAKLQHIKHIHCKVSPSISAVAPKKERRRPPMEPLSPHSAEILRGVAEEIEDDKLREILKRIANKVKSPA